MGGASSKDGINVLLETLEDHEEAINCTAVSDDGSILVTGSEDKTLRMWSTKTNETECLGILKGHTAYVTCVTTYDVYVISGSADNTVRKWDMTTCECLYCYEGHTSRLSRVLCTGDFIFSSSYDKTVKAWLFETSDLGDGDEEACVRTFKGHFRGVYSLVFIPGDSGALEDDDAEEYEINPSDLLLTGSVDNTARSWSFDTGNCLKVFKGHRGAIISMTTDDEGKTLFTGSADSEIRSWNIAMGTCLKVMDGHTGPVLCLQVVDNLLYSGSQDGTARCWVTEFGDCTRQYRGHKHSVTSIKFKNGILFTGSGDTCVRVYDAKSASLKKILHAHEAAVTSIAVLDKKIYSASSDGTLRVWKLEKYDLDEELFDFSTKKSCNSVHPTSQHQSSDQEDDPEEEEEDGDPSDLPGTGQASQKRRLSELNRRLSGYMGDVSATSQEVK